jgi:hypothetical protein
MLNVYKNQQNWQTGSMNLMGSKTLPTIWDTITFQNTCNYTIPPLPEEGAGYTVLPLSVCPSVRPRYFSSYVYAHFSSHFSQQLLMAEI